MANTEIHETAIGGLRIAGSGSTRYGLWLKLVSAEDPSDGATIYLEFPSIQDLESTARALDQFVQSYYDDEMERERRVGRLQREHAERAAELEPLGVGELREAS